jgi:hypothetical protein
LLVAKVIIEKKAPHKVLCLTIFKCNKISLKKFVKNESALGENIGLAIVK